MAATGKGTPPTSPWVWSSGSDYHDKSITATFSYDTTHALISLVTVRDPGCVWTQLVFGLGVQAKTITVLDGETTFTAAQLAALGFSTIEDVWAVQITAQ